MQMIIKEYGEEKEERKVKRNATMEEVPDKDAPEIFYDAAKSYEETPKPMWRETVPKRFHKYGKVFDKRESKHMPLRKPWDHTIELNPDFKPRKAKLYSMSPKEQTVLNEFLVEGLHLIIEVTTNLGYILHLLKKTAISTRL
jgi:hypothetical protein